MSGIDVKDEKVGGLVQHRRGPGMPQGILRRRWSSGVLQRRQGSPQPPCLKGGSHGDGGRSVGRVVASPPGLGRKREPMKVETTNRFSALCEVCEVNGVEELNEEMNEAKKFDILQVEEWPEIHDAVKVTSRKPRRTESSEPDEIGEVNEAEEVPEVDGIVEVTVDSGAARSVWPKEKGWVQRKDIQGVKPRLVAANGTDIEVVGEALLQFDVKGRKCQMKFLDADVKKPLTAVSAMEDAGNTVVFSKKWGCYVENDRTGERIPLERKGGCYVMVLDAKKQQDEKMEIGGMEDDEKGVKASDDEKGVEASGFRGQAQ